jgi:hypothetical protein
MLVQNVPHACPPPTACCLCGLSGVCDAMTWDANTSSPRLSCTAVYYPRGGSKHKFRLPVSPFFLPGQRKKTVRLVAPDQYIQFLCFCYRPRPAVQGHCVLPYVQARATQRTARPAPARLRRVRGYSGRCLLWQRQAGTYYLPTWPFLRNKTDRKQTEHSVAGTAADTCCLFVNSHIS